MNTWKIILATVVIFAAGVITGGLLVSFADRGAESPRPQELGPFKPLQPRLRDVLGPGLPGAQPPLELQRRQFLQTLQRELQLTPQQRERIAKIVRDGQEKSRAVLETVGPKLRQEWREIHENIRVELTPLQRKRFEELLKQRPPASVPGPGRGPRGQRALPHTELPPPAASPELPPPASPAPGEPLRPQGGE